MSTAIVHQSRRPTPLYITWSVSKFARLPVQGVIDEEVQVTALIGLQDMLDVQALITTRRHRITRQGFGGPPSQHFFVDQ